MIETFAKRMNNAFFPFFLCGLQPHGTLAIVPDYADKTEPNRPLTKNQTRGPMCDSPT